MLFWIVALAMTLVACLAILLPFLRAGTGDGQARADLEVYRDQLGEVDRDLGRGLIDAEQAEQARAEIARRILAASRATAIRPRWGSTSIIRATALGSVVAVPVVALAVYGAIGSPGMPGLPLDARLTADPATSSVEELIARAERHLTDNPDDARGWEVLGPVYLRQGRASEAVRAWQSAIRIAGSTAARDTGLGEALVAEAGGVVTADARAAFERALAADPAQTKAAFFSALALAQDGKLADALARWQAIKAGLDEGSPWHAVLDESIAGSHARLAGGKQAPEKAGSEAEMIEGMVASLDQRLRDNPSDAEGWQRLIRSYMVLQRPDAARDALSRAREGLAADPQARQAVTDFAASVGVNAVE